MRLARKHYAFLAFTAVFAVLAGFVFGGTWSTGVHPVMPDCQTDYSANWLRAWFSGFLSFGKFIPDDIKVFLGTPYFWQELQYVLALYCAALGMVYFLRGRGLSRLASYGAGLFLGFCGYWMTLYSAGHLGWFRWMTYGVFAFGLIDRAIEKGKLRHWLLLGATLAWGSFYQPDLWLLFTLFSAVYFVFRWIVDAVSHRVVGEKTLPWKGMLLALATFLLIGLPSFRSAVVNDLAGRNKQIASGDTISSETVDAAARKAAESSGAADAATAAAAAEREKRWIFVTNWSLPPAETLEFVKARANGDTSCPLTLAFGGRETGVKPYTGALGRPLGATQGNYRQHSLYVGWLTCLLALVGVVGGSLRDRRAGSGLFPVPARATVIFFACAAVLFYLLSLGRNCEPLYRAIFALPIGDSIRCPVKWHHLTEFCLVVLSGYGLDFLWCRFAVDAMVPIASPVRIRLAKIALVALVLWGAVDLARTDRLYCAPQPHNYQIQLAAAQQVASPQARQYLAQQGVKVLASANGIAVLGKKTRPQPWNDPLPPFSTQTALGILSILASAFVLMAAAWDGSRWPFGNRNTQ